MKKRFFTLFLIMSLLLPLIPAPARAAEADELKQVIAEQYDAYAASIAQPGADEAAIRQLLNHSLEHPGQYLEMDESDPLTASLFQSNLFREYFVETSSRALEIMEQEQLTRLLLGGGNLGWHDYALQYGARRYEYTDDLPLQDMDSHTSMIFGFTKRDISANAHDKAMILVVGGACCWLRYNELSKNLRSATYRVDVLVNDDFNFSGDYSQSAADGYDISTSLLISMVGKLFLNEYSWATSVSFDLTVPNQCTHKTKDYCWKFDVLTPIDCGGKDITENPLTLIQEVRPDGTNFGPYYQTAEPARLNHTLPWVLELRTKGAASLMLSKSISYREDEPFLLKGASWVWGGYPIARREYDEEKGKEVTKYTPHLYGETFTPQGYRAADWHIFRLENRVGQDGANMVWLLIDGNVLGPLVNYYISGEGDQEIQSDWISGKNFIINFIGTTNVKLYPPLEIDYIQIWENGEDNAPYSYFETTTIAPTCTEPGKTVYTCTLCGASYEEATGEPALGHSLEPLPGTPATCETEGLTEGTRCTTCGETVTAQEVIPALGHDWDEGVVTTPAACETNGEIRFTCNRDPSHTRVDTITPPGHVPGDPASCTAAQTCNSCGIELFPALGHIWNEGEVLTKPSPEGDGLTKFTCLTCGETKEEIQKYEGPVRIAGRDRFETALLTADQMKKNLGIEKFDTVIVASGLDFADALAGSYLASTKIAPILLAYTKDSVNDGIRHYIRENLKEGGIVYILGGENAVPSSFEEELETFQVKRLAGAHRFETNLMILKEAGISDNPS